MSTNEKMLAAGIDWYTGTARDDETGMIWWENYQRHRDEVGSLSITEKPFKNKWYNGLTCDGLTWGYSPGLGYIIIAKGQLAGKTWDHILPHAARVSRIDLQVTVGLSEPNLNLASAYMPKVERQGKRKMTLVQNHTGGQTLYIGSRQSDQFGRIYDKGVQLGQFKPGYCWRYEVEVKKPRADKVVHNMFEALRDGARPVEEVVQYVWHWFNNRSCSPIFAVDDRRQVIIEVGKRISTVDTKLTWLRTQVAPTVQRLMSEGHHLEVIDSLGITWEQLKFVNSEGYFNVG